MPDWLHAAAAWKDHALMGNVDPDKTAFVAAFDQFEATFREKRGDREALDEAYARVEALPRSGEFDRKLRHTRNEFFPDWDDAFRRYDEKELDVSGIDTTGIRFKDDDAGR